MPDGKRENAAMDSSDLRRTIAQMVMPRLDGNQLDDPSYRKDIEGLVKGGISGFILFGGDIENTPRHLARLQGLSEIPLLITSDVERGLGQQLIGGTRFPSQRAVASAIDMTSRRDISLLHRMLDAVRTETRAAGIQGVFSPVMDVNNNRDNPIICTRAFGEEPEIVEWFGARYIERLQASPIRGRSERSELLACAKHFPGHGDTDQDSHSVLPVIRADRSRLNRVELPPFRQAVKSGVGMVMIAHLLVPALDPEKPVTFSKKAVTALLREGMGFEGVIVSDALDMGALSNDYSPEEIAVRSVEAGIDILLHPKDARATIEAVASAVEKGRITSQRIEESIQRILAAKKRVGLFDGKESHSQRSASSDEKISGSLIDYEKHRETAAEICKKAPRIISGEPAGLPLSGPDGVLCFVLDDDFIDGTGGALLTGLRSAYESTQCVVITPSTDISSERLRGYISGVGAVVIAIFSRITAAKGRSGISDGLASVGERIARTAKAEGKRLIAVSFDSPYILNLFDTADTRIACYDRMDEIQQRVAEMITGR